jgi:hypothetical protein
MENPVELRLVTVSSAPSGTGSYVYEQRFDVILHRFGERRAAVVCGTEAGPPSELVASLVEPLAGDRERWRLTTSFPVTAFMVRYTVDGVTYRDDNDGTGYHVPLVTDDFAIVLGRSYAVALGMARLGGGALTAAVAVRPLAYEKAVGLVYTTDRWATPRVTEAAYHRTVAGGVEVWTTRAMVGDAPEVELAVYYRALGQERWDNNFGANYRVANGNLIAF